MGINRLFAGAAAVTLAFEIGMLTESKKRQNQFKKVYSANDEDENALDIFIESVKTFFIDDSYGFYSFRIVKGLVKRVKSFFFDTNSEVNVKVGEYYQLSVESCIRFLRRMDLKVTGISEDGKTADVMVIGCRGNSIMVCYRFDVPIEHLVPIDNKRSAAYKLLEQAADAKMASMKTKQTFKIGDMVYKKTDMLTRKDLRHVYRVIGVEDGNIVKCCLDDTQTLLSFCQDDLIDISDAKC